MTSTDNEPVDRDELLLITSRAARQGDVGAMRIVWELLQEKAGEDPDNEPEGARAPDGSLPHWWGRISEGERAELLSDEGREPAPTDGPEDAT